MSLMFWRVYVQQKKKKSSAKKIDGEYIYLIKRKKNQILKLKKMLTWKIVELAKASVIYIYIYIDNEILAFQ